MICNPIWNRHLGKVTLHLLKCGRQCGEWFDLYYGVPRAARIPRPVWRRAIVGKLCRTVFCRVRDPPAARGTGPAAPQPVGAERGGQDRDAVRAGGRRVSAETGAARRGVRLAAIRRDCYVPLARDAHGSLLAVGTMERHSVDGRQYALFERRTAGADGLTIETRLFELNGQALGRCVPLGTLPACAELVPQLVLPGVQGVGLAVLKTPLMNCVDGSTDAVSIYAPAAGLLHALARCEEQLNAEFANGASRVFASEDLLRPDAQGRRALQDDLFVGLPDDPANVGVTVYSPTLREGSYLARKQDLLRGCESLLGLRRGILSEVETPPSRARRRRSPQRRWTTT